MEVGKWRSGRSPRLALTIVGRQRAFARCGGEVASQNSLVERLLHPTVRLVRNPLRQRLEAANPLSGPLCGVPGHDVHRRPGAQPTQASNCAWQARVPSAPNLRGQGGDQLRLYTVPSRLTTALASARVLCAHLWQARAAARLLIGFNKCNAPPLSKVEQLPGDGESGWPAADDEYVYLLGRGLCAQGGGGCDVGEVHILVRSKRALETREGVRAFELGRTTGMWYS